MASRSLSCRGIGEGKIDKAEGLSQAGCEKSQRDGATVAWHEVPGKGFTSSKSEQSAARVREEKTGGVAGLLRRRLQWGR